MKKFTFKGVLDGFRSSVTQPSLTNKGNENLQGLIENLRPDHFTGSKTVRHGFPHQPTALAFDSVQHILAIGTKTGYLRLIGRPGVDITVKHKSDTAVIQIEFLINEGTFITICDDDSINLWSFKQMPPEIVHSLQFSRERITCCCVGFQSKWMYIGTERGNVHIVNIDSFILSGYLINWNKAIELQQKTHPGSVVHLSDNPVDPNKLLFGYETGLIVLWDLRSKLVECRFVHSESLKSICWHHEGKQFMSSHDDGCLATWNIKQPKPISIQYPHAKVKDGRQEACRPIQKVDWKDSKSGESFVIFSGGLSYDKAGKSPSITVIQGKSTTILEMEHNVIDFKTICETPWPSEIPDPNAIIVLLHNDLVVVDLQSANFPCYENPYPMDLHESPVTCCTYLVDCPGDLIPAFYSVGARSSKKSNFVDKEWPINGGEWGVSTNSYSEIVITGHADGSLKFWDASAISLQILYKLKTTKIFEKPKSKSLDGQEEDPFAIQQIAICPESRMLCVAGATSHVVLYKFRKQEISSELQCLEIPIVYEISSTSAEESPEFEFPRTSLVPEGDDKKAGPENYIPIKLKSGSLKRTPGYQAELVCLTPWIDGNRPGPITALVINSSYGLMAYGNESGLVIVDIIQKTCLMHLGTPDLYGSADPYQRTSRSPKRGLAEGSNKEEDNCKSPISDQPEKKISVKSGPLKMLPLAEDMQKTETITCPPALPDPEVEPAEEAEETINIDIIDEILSDKNEEESRLLTSQLINTQAPRKPVKNTHPEKDFILRKIKKPTSPTNSETEIEPTVPPRKDSRRPSVLQGLKRLFSAGHSQSNEHVKCAPIVDAEEPTAEQEEAVDPVCEVTNQFTVPEAASELPPPEKPPRKRKSRDEGEKSKSREPSPRRRQSDNEEKVTEITDLRGEAAKTNHPGVMFGFMDLLRGTTSHGQEKLDSSFARSRSSSMSSLDNISSEAIQCLAFIDSYTRKGDSSTWPTLWVGTSLGSVIVITINFPPVPELRQTQPLIVMPSGTIFRLKGGILAMSFLDCNGALIPYSYESWKSNVKNEGRDKTRTPTRNSATINKMSPTQGNQETQIGDCRQFAVLASEKHARVVALPSLTCAYRQQLTDNYFVVKAEIVSMKDSVCLVAYIANGRLVAYSLPSLKPLLDIDFLPLTSLSFQTTRKQGIVDPMLSIWGQQMFVNEDTDQIVRTFCFSNHGQGLYLCSPSEIQKFTIDSDFGNNLLEMMGTLFTIKEIPEPPKEGFFKGLFGGGVRSLDREELFGEEKSGKASKTIAKHIPGPAANIDMLNVRANTVAGDIARTRNMLVERGEKLGQLEDKSARMMNQAEDFSSAAHQLMLRYRDKKWYQL